MATALSLVTILVASIALIKGTSLFITSSSRIAHHFKVSGYTISFFLVAIGTSLPETIVGITSALDKNPILSYGTAMGSNVALMTLIAAIPAILVVGGISTRTILNSRDVYFTSIFSIAPVLLAVDGRLNATDGIILLLGYALYGKLVLRRSTQLENIRDKFDGVSILKQLGLFALGLAILLGSSHLIVVAALDLSTTIGLGIGFVGLTITAVGTSLPEIAFTLGSIRRGEHEQILGDVIGSVVANATLVLGVTAIIYPIDVAASKIGMPTVFFLVLIMLLFLKFVRSKEKLDTKEGIILLTVYALFVVSEFLVATH